MHSHSREPRPPRVCARPCPSSESQAHDCALARRRAQRLARHRPARLGAQHGSHNLSIRVCALCDMPRWAATRGSVQLKRRVTQPATHTRKRVCDDETGKGAPTGRAGKGPQLSSVCGPGKSWPRCPSVQSAAQQSNDCCPRGADCAPRSLLKLTPIVTMQASPAPLECAELGPRLRHRLALGQPAALTHATWPESSGHRKGRRPWGHICVPSPSPDFACRRLTPRSGGLGGQWDTSVERYAAASGLGQAQSSIVDREHTSKKKI